MEGNIVRDFENLRVFVKHNQIRMDELVQDLTTALEESATGGRNPSQPEGAECNKPLLKRYVKKRRGIRRSSSNNYYWKRGTISEASESSVDETIKDPTGNIVHSDSDDLSSCPRIPKLTVSMVDAVPPVESDSFTENLSPLRPQRRRRKFKTMAVDSSPLTDTVPSDSDSIPSNRQQSFKRREDMTMIAVDRLVYPDLKDSTKSSGTSYNEMSGKRKRGSKTRAEYSLSSGTHSLSQLASATITDRMEVANASQESSLSSSEFDSDVNTYTEDAREADDEQSDFFHEPGPACGIPDIVPWWENERVTDKPLRMDSDFEKILTGTFEHLPKLSNQSFKARVGKLVSGGGREIRLGRRKLKGKMPRYTVGRFLQDREHWSRMQGQLPTFQIPGSSNNNNSNGHPSEFKKRRHITRNCGLDVTGVVVGNQTSPDQGLETKSHRSPGSTIVKASPNTAVSVKRSGRKSNHTKTNVSDS